MSTLIQFRVSGDDEKAILNAAEKAGMRPAAYVRQSVKLAANRPEAALEQIQRKMEALEQKVDAAIDARAQPPAPMGPTATINGIEVSDLVIEIRREVRIGFNAILALLDGDLIPDITSNSQAPPDRRN